MDRASECQFSRMRMENGRIWIDARHWAKLCFEFSPAGEAMIVSVITRGVSDDANGFVVDGRSVWLRVSLRDGS